jgi:hypothetical protein
MSVKMVKNRNVAENAQKSECRWKWPKIGMLVKWSKIGMSLKMLKNRNVGGNGQKSECR